MASSGERWKLRAEDRQLSIDIDDLAMSPVPDSKSIERSLVGRSRVQSIPAWDNVTLANRSISTSASTPPILLSWHDVCVKPKVAEGCGSRVYSCVASKCGGSNKDIKGTRSQREFLLNNVFGVAKPGEMLAILGASGSGKTTLLNVLTRRNLEGLEVDGVVKVNGNRVGRRVLRRISAYVQQNDLFCGTMTVREHLHFNAALRMGRDCPREEQRRRVQNVITELGLESCAESLVGIPGRVKGISGGERKRLAFACEALMGPPLLFCDEPTTGLDSFFAQQVVQVLKRLSHRMGMTVVVTIHQPASQVFEMFDRICIMSEGRVAFNGSTSEALALWNGLGHPLPKNYNPADHFIKTLAMFPGKELECLRNIERICTAFEESEAGKAVYREAIGVDDTSGKDAGIRHRLTLGDHRKSLSIEDSPKYNSSWLTQMEMVMWRSALTTLRDPAVLRIRLFQVLLVALVDGLVYMGTPLTQSTVRNMNGVMFMLTCNMNYLFQFVVVDLLCGELPAFMREHQSGLYRTGTYFTAKNIAEAPQFIVLPVIFLSIVYWMAGLAPSFSAFCLTCLICVLLTNVGTSIGYAFSCMLADDSLALNVMPAFVMPAMAFCGFFIKQDTLPIYFYYLKYLSYFGYAYESLAINEWSNVGEIPGCANSSTCLQTGPDVLHSMGFTESHLLFDLLALVALLLLFR